MRIAVLPLPGGGALGIMACPGRDGRDLAADLAAIRAWGAIHLLSLAGPAELARLGVPDLPPAALGAGLRHHAMPIADYGVPDAAALAAWAGIAPGLRACWAGGGRVAVHCAAGLGRSGMVAAWVLTGFGMPAAAAIAAVRAARPGAIETAAQEAFIRDGPRPFPAG